MDSRITDLIAHPLHSYIGITELTVDGGSGKFSVPVHRKIVNHADVLHGGVIYLLCDVCALCSLLSILATDKAAATNNINISLLRPAKLGTEAQFKAKVLRLGSRLAFVGVEVLAEGELIATAQVTKSIMNLTH